MYCKVNCLATLVLLIGTSRMEATTVGVNVPGTANPWLAGMPNGSPADGGDIAPDQSPVEVLGLPLAPGGRLRFSAAGLTSFGPGFLLSGPDGSGFNEHFAGAENGIANTNTRTSSLQGVFLGVNQPDLTPAPAGLDFTVTGNVAGGVSYLSLSPLLKQVFFIGDGLTEDVLPMVGQTQEVIIPSGATRLFLGTMDGFGWFNNIGSLDVQVTLVPEPSSFVLAALGLVGLADWRRRKGCSRR
jgi:hypothetical protein